MSLSCLCLCVGQFDIRSIAIRKPDEDAKAPSLFATCFGPKGTADSMKFTMRMFSSVFKFVESTLNTTYPFKNLKVLFLPDAVPLAAGRHDCIVLSTTLLFANERKIDHGEFDLNALWKSRFV